LTFWCDDIGIRPVSDLKGGIISGLIFGAVSVALMLPLQFTDERTALTAAFISPFAIGLVIGCIVLPWPGCVRFPFELARRFGHKSVRADFSHWISRWSHYRRNSGRLALTRSLSEARANVLHCELVSE
jgi:hypothetical protein